MAALLVVTQVEVYLHPVITLFEMVSAVYPPGAGVVVSVGAAFAGECEMPTWLLL